MKEKTQEIWKCFHLNTIMNSKSHKPEQSVVHLIRFSWKQPLVSFHRDSKSRRRALGYEKRAGFRWLGQNPRRKPNNWSDVVFAGQKQHPIFFFTGWITRGKCNDVWCLVILPENIDKVIKPLVLTLNIWVLVQ